MSTPGPRQQRVAVVALLLAAVAVVYAPVAGHAFLDLDDNEYVTANPMVAGGLTPAGVRQAFTSLHAANWHPLTWLSHMLDVQLFGLHAGAHHLMNAALHALASILLFLVLASATGHAWRSGLVAGVFAVHPLHVESVAWVSERKDVLCAVFLFLAMGAHLRFARTGRTVDRLLVFSAVALALLAKPMAVTAPFVLLLLDVWPLRRVGPSPTRTTIARVGVLALEKTELFVLAAASSLLTVRAQSAAHAVEGSVALPARLANAAVSYVAYLRDALWPTGLSAYYPHPASLGGTHDAFAVAACVLLLAAVTVTVLRRLPSAPHLAVGWLWYLGVLVPAIGLVQVGFQARADRYTYVPLVGVAVAVVWGVADRVATSSPGVRRAASIAAVLVLVAWAALAHRQVGVWRTPAALYTHAIALEPRNWFAWSNLSAQQVTAGHAADALRSARTARTLRPDFANAWYNEGVALAELGRGPEALAAYRRALDLDPGDADAWVNAALVQQTDGAYRDALASYGQALRIRPDDPVALYWSVALQLRLGQRGAALEGWKRLAAVDRGRADELSRWVR